VHSNRTLSITLPHSTRAHSNRNLNIPLPPQLTAAAAAAARPIFRTPRYTHYDYEPKEPLDNLFAGTYYVKAVDGLERRQYARSLHTSVAARRAQLAGGTAVAALPLSTPARRASPQSMVRLHPGLQTLARGLRLLRR